MKLKKHYSYLAIALIPVLLFFPLCRQLVRSGRELETLQGKLEEGKRAARELAQVSEQKETVQRQLQGAEKVQISDLMLDLIAIGRSDVAIVSLTPGELRAAGGQVVQPLSLELAGSYPALLDTLYRLGRAKHNWVIRALSLEGREDTIKCSLDLLVPAGGEAK